jgi:endogenous inhibitor of DNA gyrase (YacG/DUF329 family)
MADNVVVLKPTRPCPICKKPSSQQHHPFCSARCADIDLNRWLSGAYVIPAEPLEDDEDESSIPSDPGEDDES